MTASTPRILRTQFKSIPRPSTDWLSDALDTHLSVSHRVRDFHPDPFGDEKLARCLAPEGAIMRSVKLRDRALTVVAIPGGSPAVGMRGDLAARLKIRNLLIVGEAWLMWQPRLDIKSALVMAGDYRLARQDRLIVEQHLLEVGGSSCLADCAAHVLLDDDPVRCVLALVEQGALRIDYARPLSWHSIISLPVRRDRGRLVVGG